MTFEDAIKRLEEISSLMENPEITLKNAVELYSEANRLAEICNKSIEEAKIALEKIEE
ncbi:MAG: exodeoxyribonuclease VII small subunit [Firmicutes bacterium]|nr:exodeoxyribonuclease VII small subunit [[Eubacterium] siraeum]MCM1487384.1 exodeoxyribonuclease VII small subunit [Bacillota bacterium]